MKAPNRSAYPVYTLEKAWEDWSFDGNISVLVILKVRDALRFE
jgi:hypothetical protein